MKTEVDFGTIAAKVYRNYGQHLKNLKDCCVAKTVMKPPAFFENLQLMLEEETATMTPPKDLGSVAEYAELFKTLEEYPTNLQKMPKKRGELQRANSTLLRSTETSTAAQADQSTAINTSNVSLSMTRLEEQPSAVEVYKDFRAFQRKLEKIYEETAALDTMESVYKQKLAQIHGFAQQVEKLMPTGGDAPPDAFSADQQEKLLALAANMEELNYLCSNTLPLPNPSELMANGARLEMFVDVLTYALMQISSYNMVLI
ncbi:hypothetical protein KR032_006249 [Drosophila birchii]|nr:hypothetical protein KR032_006249 [Drosophila birchii]